MTPKYAIPAATTNRYAQNTSFTAAGSTAGAGVLFVPKPAPVWVSKDDPRQHAFEALGVAPGA